MTPTEMPPKTDAEIHAPIPEQQGIKGQNPDNTVNYNYQNSLSQENKKGDSLPLRELGLSDTAECVGKRELIGGQEVSLFKEGETYYLVYKLTKEYSQSISLSPEESEINLKNQKEMVRASFLDFANTNFANTNFPDSTFSNKDIKASLVVPIKSKDEPSVAGLSAFSVIEVPQVAIEETLAYIENKKDVGDKNRKNTQ